MSRALAIYVRFHDGRYHGTPDWPPSPARLFQALVAGTAGSGQLADWDQAALEWLETLSPPTIAAPSVREGRRLTSYVPNNDLDSVNGDPARIAEVRAPKIIKPLFFDAETQFQYLWTFSEGHDADKFAHGICGIACNLYQLGRGIDMAWAWGEVLDEAQAGRQLNDYAGVVHRACQSGSGAMLACPEAGSLRSLLDRHAAQRLRFTNVVVGKNVQQIFSQPPKPLFRQVAYNSPASLQLYDLIGTMAPWPLVRCAELVTRVRDAAAKRLTEALPDRKTEVERALVGRGASEADKATRVRILPLPSIGHQHADHAIRRILVEASPNCSIRSEDIAWAFSGLASEIDIETGEVRLDLVPAADSKMLWHYGVDESRASRRWRTVTPTALPEAAGRRRIDPGRIREEAKSGAERVAEQNRAAGAVLQALRHAGIRSGVSEVRVQREPFEAKGARAETFAAHTRFAKERLWHIELGFTDPVVGPLAIGDGRYCGLGLMAPVEGALFDALIFRIDERTRPLASHRVTVVEALRRALMSRERDRTGRVSTLFSGHEFDSDPARSGHHRHVYLFAEDDDDDGFLDRIGVIAPWRVDRSWTPLNESRAAFESVTTGLEFVRAGVAGVLTLQPWSTPGADDPLFGHAYNWVSRTQYRATRHAKRSVDATAALSDDLLRECLRRGLPRPAIEITSIEKGSRAGVRAKARLKFSIAVAGPIVLGQDAHRGGGMFARQQ